MTVRSVTHCMSVLPRPGIFEPEAAYSLAELLALDLSVRERVTGKAAIGVSDARGRRYFLVPVQLSEPEED